MDLISITDVLKRGLNNRDSRGEKRVYYGFCGTLLSLYTISRPSNPRIRHLKPSWHLSLEYSLRVVPSRHSFQVV